MFLQCSFLNKSREICLEATRLNVFSLKDSQQAKGADHGHFYSFGSLTRCHVRSHMKVVLVAVT